MSSDPQVVWHSQLVSLTERESRYRHKGAVLWFTGLSGSGKSTVANALDRKLFDLGCTTFLLDGDNVRHGLCSGPNLLTPVHGESFANRFGLGFGAIDREENIRRVGAVTELFASAGILCLTAFVSPYRADRMRVRNWVDKQMGPNRFIEIFVDTPLETCIERDPKGLYQQAIAGKIKNFTGISDPYESPESPELTLHTKSHSPEACADQVLLYLQQHELLTSE
jgi:adenylylsulfate kinase